MSLDLKSYKVIIPVVLCCIFLGNAMFSAAAQSKTTTSSFVTIQNTTVPIPSNYLNLGLLSTKDPLAQISGVVGLQSSNPANMQAFENYALSTATPGSPTYHHYLTHQQIMNKFGPGQSAYNTVSTYLSSEGLTLSSATYEGHPLTDQFDIAFSGTVSRVQNAFSVTLNLYTDGISHYIANTVNVQLPSNVGQYVSSVIGLENITQFTPMLSMNPSASSSPASPASPALPNPCVTGPPYCPATLESAYNATAVYNQCGQCAGSYTTIAVVDAYGDPTATTDLTDFDTGFFGGNIATLNLLYPYGNPNPPACLPSCANAAISLWELETAVDIQMANGMAPGNDTIDASTMGFTGPPANIDSVVSPDSDVTLTMAVNYIIINNLANVISQSFGESDLETGPFATFAHVYFVMAAAEGISVLAASGDSGAVAPGTSLVDTSWPASDTFVIAVGGTTLMAGGTSTGVNCEVCGPPTYDTIANPSGWANETAWDGDSGGGFSPVYTRPVWQQGPGVPACDQCMRGVPDVSANAQFEGNYFYVNNQPATSYAFGGTSYASPMVGGMIATLDSYFFIQFGVTTQAPLGFLDPAFYQILSSPYYHLAFHDITVGYNSGNSTTPGYNATVGWDPVTGIGSINLGNLEAVLSLYSMSAGAQSSNPTLKNYGVQAQIQTVIPSQTYGGNDLYYVEDSLSDGSTLYVGYSEALAGSPYGVNTWFYGWIPAGSQFGTYFFTFGQTGTAGAGNAVNTYTITASHSVGGEAKRWTFEMNGQVLGTYQSSTGATGSNPLALASAFGVTNSYNVLGPATFTNFAIQLHSGAAFTNIPHANLITITTFLDPAARNMPFTNPYTAHEVGTTPDDFVVGTTTGPKHPPKLW